MSNKYKAVIFDIDGTLVDSMWIWRQVDIDYLAKFGIAMPPGLPEAISGISVQQTAVYFQNNFNINDKAEDMIREWNEMAEEHYRNDVKLKEGIPELLQYLDENNIPMGIATSNTTYLVNIIFDRFNIEDHFKVVITGDRIFNGKPAPDIFLAVAEEMEIDPRDCLVFEDTTEGIRAARAAGMTVCAIYDKATAYKDEEKRNLSDYYITSFREVNFI